MTIDKAIGKLQEELNYGEGSHERELEDAIKLGMEALKRLQVDRSNMAFYGQSLLPGETKD